MAEKILRYYRIGGLVIKVSAPFYEDSEILKVFRCEASVPDAEFDFEFKDKISAPDLPIEYSEFDDTHYTDGKIFCRTLQGSDGKILLKVQGDGKHYFAELDAAHPEYLSAHLVLMALELPRLMLLNSALFLHASLIKWQGKTIAFTADKQVGKSTQAALWEKYRGAKIINGDRALIAEFDGKWCAYGSPYCGTSKICENDFAPLAAIVILGQAEETEIRKATTAEALAAIMSGASYSVRSRAETEHCLEVCGKIIGDVPFLRLDCTPDETAVEALCGALENLYAEK